jgi:CSLREA domain-containing protein
MALRGRVLGILVGAAVTGSFLTAAPAHAPVASAVVTKTADTNDGTCDADCSLREAITAVNAAAGPAAISFNIPGAGVHTITPTSALPAITGPITIDGYSQAGSSKNSLAYGTDAVLTIEIDGSALASGNGIELDNGSAGSTVRGLVINNFSPGEGIRVQSNSDANYHIEGCFIGTEPDGLTAAPNGKGVRASSGSSITVGGNDPGQRNLIAANTNGSAINPAGEGVIFETLSNNNTVIGNLIGVDKTGSPLPNETDGVAITGSSTGNRILDNVISSDAQSSDLGIDLGTDGVTPNDTRDPDPGSNNLQNFPVLKTATVNVDGTTTIVGRLNSRPRTVFTIQFFANAFGDEPDGEIPLGQLNIKTNRFGKASFKFITTEPVAGAETVTATATNAGSGDTSEFSAPVPAAVG